MFGMLVFCILAPCSISLGSTWGWQGLGMVSFYVLQGVAFLGLLGIAVALKKRQQTPFLIVVSAKTVNLAAAIV